MKKVLRIIAISSAIVSAISLIVLACVCFDDVASFIKNAKAKFAERKAAKEALED